MEHEFTQQIQTILHSDFGEVGGDILQRSELLQYLNIKTRSATRGSKARGSFANLYALYVLIEDYINHGFDEKGTTQIIREWHLQTYSSVKENYPLVTSCKIMRLTTA